MALRPRDWEALAWALMLSLCWIAAGISLWLSSKPPRPCPCECQAP